MTNDIISLLFHDRMSLLLGAVLQQRGINVKSISLIRIPVRSVQTTADTDEAMLSASHGSQSAAPFLTHVNSRNKSYYTPKCIVMEIISNEL